jgi:ribosomal protein S18 acetylase RimI-like enzyme
MVIRPARIPDDIPEVRQLFLEYAAGLGFSLCFQNFDAELASLPGKYAPPTGLLLVAGTDAVLVGCVALREHQPAVGELKRLFVRPEFRRLGLGRQLLNRILAEAMNAGYREVVFDTLPVMTDALRIYEKLGFVATEPYCVNPVEGALFFRKTLTS